MTTSAISRDASPARASGAATLLLAFMWGAYFLNYCDRQAVLDRKSVV